MSSPISRVSVFSTGLVQIRPEHVGPTRQSMYVWLLLSRRWTAPRPINVYVIEHEAGVIVFDTGQDRASITDPEYFPGGLTGFLYRRLARFEVGETETLRGGLSGLGLTAADVRYAVISHLHQDHIGGLAEVIGAEVIVSEAELLSLREPFPELRGLMRAHIELPGIKWSPAALQPLADASLGPFTHGRDLFGDGSIVVLPTPGHTPGSLSLLVRGAGRPLLMVGDLTYDDDLLAQGHVPGVGEKRRMRESAAKVNALRETLPGLVILPAHDPGAAARLRSAQRG